MSHDDDPSLLNAYQFPRWSTTIPRPRSALPTKNVNRMSRIGIDNRDQSETFSKKRLTRHNIHISSGTRALSPPVLHQPTPSPDLGSVIDQFPSVPSNTPIPVRIKSSPLTLPVKTNSNEKSSKNFPKESHERRKITQERKRQKQRAYKYLDEDSDTWFQLRQSLAELKRLATTEDILVDPVTSLFNCNGYSFQALKQAISEQQEQQKINRFKSESGMSSPMDTIHSFNNRSRTSLTASQNSLSHSRISRQSTETFPRRIFEPLIVAAKPIHPLLLTGNNHSGKTTTQQIKPPSSAPSRVRFPPSPTFVQKRVQSVLSDLSSTDDPPISSTPSPPLLQNVKEEEEEEEERKAPDVVISDHRRPVSNLSLRSTIKLKPQIPRCRSANDTRSSFTLNKTSPRFILITDQEHRIESWYHQYPFIVSDDLLQSFQSKPTKTTVSAYFTDDHQQFYHSNFITKTFLQGKAFHINNDWKKYDLIFISNNIYRQIIIHLQTIIKLSGKLIHIYQLNHNEDLKTQVRYICKQLNQQISAHL